MGQDGRQHGLHIVAVLLGRAVGQVGVEVLGFELGDGVVFLLELTLETGGQNGSFGAALALGELGGHILNRRDGTTETFAELTAQIGDLHELVTTDGIHVGTHGGQGLHHILVAVITAATAAAAVVIVPVATATPGRTHGTTDGATDESAAPVAHAVVVTADVESRLETVQEKNSL